MKNTKKVVSIGLACTLSVGLLAGCGTSKETGTQTTQNKDGNEKVTISAMVQQSRYYDGLQAMIEKLEKEENIIVDVQVVPDAESLNMIKMKLNSGEAPDIIDYNIPAVYDIVDPASNFADLSDEAWVDNLLIPDNVKNKEDGKIYGFPFLSVPGTHGFIYNVDVFEKAGITKVPETWEELLDVCQTLKDAGITPIYMPKDSWVPQVLMTDNFAKALGAEKAQEYAEKLMNNEMKWTDIPEMAEIIDKYLELYEKGYINENFTSATYDDAIASVADGSAAMHFNGDFFAASVLEANPDANVGMFAISMKDGVDVVTENMSSPGFVVYKDSENMDTVKKVLNLWSTPEYANLYFEDRPGFPAFKDVDGGEVPEYLKDINEKFILCFDLLVMSLKTILIITSNINLPIPSAVFNTIFPVNPSVTTTSIFPFITSVLSTFPTKFMLLFSFSRLYASLVTSFPFPSSVPIFKSPTLEFFFPTKISIYLDPIIAY